MDRQTAIAQAEVLRFHTTTINPLTGDEQQHMGQIPRFEYTDRLRKDWKGNVVSRNQPYKVTWHTGPSIAAAKRSTRGRKCVALTRDEYRNFRTKLAARHLMQTKGA